MKLPLQCLQRKQSLLTRSITSISNSTIPIVDLSPYVSSTSSLSDKQSTSSAVINALSMWGFLYVMNTPLSSHIINNANTSAKAFFGSTSDSKMKVDSRDGHGYYQYTHKGGSSDYIEALKFGNETAGNPLQLRMEYFNKVSFPLDMLKDYDIRNKWPAHVKDFSKDSIIHYFNACAETSDILLKAIAVGLKLPEDYFLPFHDKHDCILEFKKYPPPSKDIESLERLGSHADLTSITILTQDAIGGLQVFNKVNNSWIDVPHIEDTLLINTGDFMSEWTGGLLPSTLHRVVTKNTSDHSNISTCRHSIVYFSTPNWETKLSKKKNQITKEMEDVLIGDVMPLSL